MESAGEQQVAAAAVESPADFLKNLGNALRASRNIDVSLAAILAEHLLTATPAADAIAKAKAAVLKLAIERADCPKPKVGDD